MRFSFAPSIQEAGGLENTMSAPCKQREAKNGGHPQSNTAGDRR
jgi:hypothetical protein